jgi:hydrogenase expression/formation protein HypE
MSQSLETITCPIPFSHSQKILLGHGSGGKLTSQLIDNIFLPIFGNSSEILHDGAFLSVADQQLAFTTDSYVVNPLFFPGGNIGGLAVNGTVNDLAMCGALPVWLSCGFILEEGFEIEKLIMITKSMKQAADKVGVKIVTGDTKVVEKGKGDGLYVNTSGIGIVNSLPMKPENIQSGDVVIVNGDIGRHGTAILSVREGLAFDSVIESDTQELSSLTQALLLCGGIHCMRDVTRGGLATVLVELAAARGLTIEIDETDVPVNETVRGACELLGLDPLYVACEGRMVAFVDKAHADKVLDVMTANACQPQVIGQVVNNGKGIAVAKTFIRTKRLLDRLTGDQLPRIC